MKHLSLLFAVVFLSLLSIMPARAQQFPPLQSPDTTSILGGLREPMTAPSFSPLNSWGVDLLISNGGFGLGTFYRHEYTEDFSGFLNFSVSEAKDDDEKDYVDFFGRVITPGKVNRFLVIPLYIGVQQRLFGDDIVDNFRPYISAAAGPTMIYVFPYNEEYFTAIGNGSPRYTVGGYVGIGAFFGTERSSLLGMNLRYYFVPYPGGVESLQGISKKQFGGFYITLNFGSAW